MKRLLFILPLLVTLLGAKDPDPKAVIGKIDDKTYTYAEYNKTLTNYLAYYAAKQSTPLTAEDKAQLNERCWEELVGRHIYDTAIKAGKITITNTELLAEAKKNIPTDVKQIKDLQTNGKFDKAKYEKALNEIPDFKKAVLDEVRSMYQYTKLLNAIKAEVNVPADSVKQEWYKDQDRVDAQIIFFDANKMTSVTATDEEARMYYNERKEEYRKDNCRRYKYVHFTKAATAADSLATKERVWQMYRDLLNGADFAEMARNFSQDPGSGKNGGDLGWFGKGKMIPVFEETAFKTADGQIAEPILSQFGWHIVQTMGHRSEGNGDEVSARHILIKNDPSAETFQLMKSQSANLYDLSKIEGLDSAAAEMHLKVEETPVFQATDTFIRGIGREAKLITFAFDNPEGSLADIYYAPSGDTFVMMISAVLPVYYTPYEDDATRIKDSATRSKRGYLMNEYVQKFIQDNPQDQYLSAASKDSIAVVEITDHKRGDDITSIGKQEALEETLFSLPEGSFSPLISEQMRWFLAKVTKHQKPDPTLWEKNKSELIQTALKARQQDHLNQWYRTERQKVSIIDNRRDFYDLSSVGGMQMLKP